MDLRWRWDDLWPQTDTRRRARWHGDDEAPRGGMSIDDELMIRWHDSNLTLERSKENRGNISRVIIPRVYQQHVFEIQCYSSIVYCFLLFNLDRSSSQHMICHTKYFHFNNCISIMHTQLVDLWETSLIDYLWAWDRVLSRMANSTIVDYLYLNNFEDVRQWVIWKDTKIIYTKCVYKKVFLKVIFMRL